MFNRISKALKVISVAAHSRPPALAIMLLILLAASAGAGQQDNSAFAILPSGDFGTLDLNTGAFVMLGDSGIVLSGMAVVNGTIYGADWNQSTSQGAPIGTLYIINPTNGSLTAVGTAPVSYDTFGGTTTGGLYAVGRNEALYSIDPTTGAATEIGGILNQFDGWRSLSNNASTLYYVNGPNLYTVSTFTGAVTLVANMGGPQMSALLEQGGVLYGGQVEISPGNSMNSPSVATIDPTTGAVTQGPLITTSSPGVTGVLVIEAMVPSPLPPAMVTLNPSTAPSAGDPAATNLSVTGQGFPAGSIPPGNVTVTLNPATVGGGPSGTTTAIAVTVVSGSTESVTFQIPPSIMVASPTSYQVSIAGTASSGYAFQSNTASLTVDAPLAIMSASPLPKGQVGVAYSQTLAATGGSGQYAWSVSSGALPDGLTLDAASGLINGQPTTAGTSQFTVQVTDSLMTAVSKSFALVVVPPPQLTMVSPNWGNVGTSLQATITGAYTHFRQGSTRANFGPGISVGGAADGQPGLITVNSPTSATAELTISATAATGSEAVTVATGAEDVSLASGFTIFPDNPKLTILHRFSGQLRAGLAIGGDGVLYGTTIQSGNGTVFSLTPPASQGGAWTETTLHSFAGQPGDGANPFGGVAIGSGGVLYGTTQIGGTSNHGTVFSLTPPAVPGGAWTETILHNFTGHPGDGASPLAGVVIDSAGVLYGTTSLGGNAGGGTVFSLTPPATPGASWTEALLHQFGASSDGSQPEASPTVDHNGVLFGTTSGGGTSGYGIVFSLKPPASPGGHWAETILHQFSGSPGDGRFSTANVIIGSGGVLYGATFDGGSANSGAVFSLMPPASPGGPWTETILHSFLGGSDGRYPVSGLTIGAGVLYGTTSAGGGSDLGTVFSLTPPASPGGPWTETILHKFTGGDGSSPYGNLAIDGTGLLYGTTILSQGGHGVGVVFSLTP